MNAKMIIMSAAILIIAALGFISYLPQAQHTVAESRKAATTLKIQSTEVHTFKIEIADTDAERNRGLMYREHLADDAGMLFLFQDYAPRRFWMRNTLIPLDIIFIDENGTINDIIHLAQPHDENLRMSNAPAKAALEINGGLSLQKSIEIGDTVIFPPFFTKELAQ